MQSKDPFIGRYPASDHQDLIQIVGPGGGVQWRLSQMSTTWFSGSGSPTTSAFPGALANNLYYDTTSGNVWQFGGTTWALLVTAPSGDYISFEDDFTNTPNQNATTSEAVYPSEQNWMCISSSGDASITYGGGASFQSPGVVKISPAANKGASLFRGDNSAPNYEGPLGQIVYYSGWQIDCWFVAGGFTTEYANRVGFCTSGQAIADAPSGGAWIEFDSSNPNSSSGFALRTADSGTSAYIPLGYTPIGGGSGGDGGWNHVTLASPAPGVIVCQLVVQNGFTGVGSVFSASVTSTFFVNTETEDSYMPMMQVFDRGDSSSTNLAIDRFSYSAPTGRI